jgi:hypothetical protein
MTDIAKLDKNFDVDINIPTEDTVFYDVKEHPFCLFGLIYEEGGYRRLPQAVAETVSPAVAKLNLNTAGGRIRFMTDSPFVSILASMPKTPPHNNQSPTGSSSFDLFIDGLYSSTFTYPMAKCDDKGYAGRKSVPRGVLEFVNGKAENGATGMHEITIHFPLYHDVREVSVGLNRGAKFLPAPAYKTGKRAITYGSSITQGGCASIPGLAYSNLLCMRLGIDLWNFGFSGNAKGEDAICDYIAQQKPDIFLMDYDHNAPTLEHLKSTHERFFRRFRASCPETPVILLSAPNYDVCPSWFEPRRQVVEATYRNALRDGDKNVYFIDGRTLFGEEYRDLCTVDATHPNDVGFMRMTDCISAVLEKLL